MLEKSPQILVIPIDNRPVCYDLLKDTLAVFSGAKLIMPDKNLLGDLTNSAKILELQNWLKETISNHEIDVAIIALDTIAYGGLVQSRKTSANFNEIKSYIDSFIGILNSSAQKIKIYATSSIMRISNNNCNEEEKSYWENYGTDLFRYSYLAHKLLKDYDLELEAELIKLSKKIPFEIIEDYLDTRKRNFEINSYYIDLLKQGYFEYLVFSQDDTAEFGLNIEEKELLHRQSIKELVHDKVALKTGADEIILSLLSRAMCNLLNEKPEILPFYADNKTKNIVSMYEDLTIENSVRANVELCGAKISTSLSAIQLLVNTPNKFQNDLCLGIMKDLKNNGNADKLFDYVKNINKKFAIADVRNANGADNYFVENFLKLDYSDDKIYGYAGWNTTSNTLGTVISMSVIKFLAIKYNAYDIDAFKKLLAIRFLDDWAYQANVRKIIRNKGSVDNIVEEMSPFKDRISDYLGCLKEITYSFPWDRTFEIEIKS